MTLTEFLLARIAEDEAVAHYDKTRGEWVTHTDRTPARVLAECEAKRRIVKSVEFHLPRGTNGLGPSVLMYLALPYADHPDYDEAWRP